MGSFSTSLPINRLSKNRGIISKWSGTLLPLFPYGYRSAQTYSTVIAPLNLPIRYTLGPLRLEYTVSYGYRSAQTYSTVIAPLKPTVNTAQPTRAYPDIQVHVSSIRQTSNLRILLELHEPHYLPYD